MDNIRCAIIVSLLALMAACATPIPQGHTVIQSGTQSGLRNQSSHAGVIVDMVAFEQLYRQLNNKQLPAPDTPVVDFGKNIVVFLSSDIKPTTGYSLRVASVLCDKGLMKIRVESAQPMTSNIQAQVVTQPFVVIATPRCPGLVAIEISGGDFVAQRQLVVPPQ